MTNVLLFFWITLALVLIVTELGHPGLFYFLAAGCAAFITALSVFYFPTIGVQLSIFLSSFLLLFYLFSIYLKPYLSDKTVARTNMYALIGKHAFVVLPVIPEKMGQIKVDGEIWSARLLKGINQEIPYGAQVEIVQVIGCHCVVKPINER